MPNELTDEELRHRMFQICRQAKKEDYAFTVMALGTPWDVYRFQGLGAKGMFAFREHKGQHEIGFFQVGEFTREQVIQSLTENAPN